MFALFFVATISFLGLRVTRKLLSPRLLVVYEIFMVGPVWYNKLVTSESDMDIDTLAGLGMEQMSPGVSCRSFFDRMQYLFTSYFLKVHALEYSISWETSFHSRDSSVMDFSYIFIFLKKNERDSELMYTLM